MTNAARPPPSIAAVRRRARVFAADIASFTKLTSAWVAQDRRGGAERAADAVTKVFAALAVDLSKMGLRTGGFAGDALTAWADADAADIGIDAFQSAVLEALAKSGETLEVRIGAAHGEVFAGEARGALSSIPLIWGGPVAEVFRSLDSAPKSGPGESASGRAPARQSALSKTADASVYHRWNVALRAFGPDVDAAALNPSGLGEVWRICTALAEGFGGRCDNIVQDDKGLVVWAGFPDADGSRRGIAKSYAAEAERALSARGGLAHTGIGHGLVFQTSLPLADRAMAITIGESLNLAAKSLLADTQPAQPSLPAAIASKGVFIGRSVEQMRLQTLIGNAAPGDNKIAIVTGPPGVGKSAFVDHVLSQSSAQGHRVLRISLRPSDAFAPYSGLQSIADSLGAPEPEAQSAGKPIDRFAQADDLAKRLAGGLVIDNWQWCDPESKRLIQTLIPKADLAFVVLASRPSDDPPFPSETALHIALDGLALTDANLLLEARPGLKINGQDVSTLLEISGGNPFWLLEISKDWSTSPDPTSDGAHPGGLDAFLHRRAETLSSGARFAWRLLCTWQEPIQIDKAANLVEQLGGKLAERHLDEIDALGWLSTDQSGDQLVVAPAHRILADWGRSSLPVTVERALNTRIARILTHDAEETSRIARHWRRAGAKGRASIMFERAATEAVEAGAYQSAKNLLGMAEAEADSALSTISRRRSRLSLRATSDWGLGEIRSAKRSVVAHDALDQAMARRRRVNPRVEFVRAEAGQFSGDPTMVLRGVLRGVALRDRSSDTWDARARRSGFFNYLIGLSGAPAYGRLHALTAKAEAAGQPRAAALLLNAQATLAMSRGDWTRAAGLLERSSIAVATTQDFQLRGVVTTLQALRLLFMGDGPGCAQRFRDLRDLTKRQRNRMFDAWADYGEAEGLLVSGEFAEARRLAAQALDKLTGLGEHQSPCIAEGVVARCDFALGDRRAALVRARRALKLASPAALLNFSSLEGVSAPAELAARAAVDGDAAPETLRLMRDGRALLARYARTIPIARPRLALVDGLIAASQDRRRPAKTQFNKALSKAQKIAMAHDMRLAEGAVDDMT